MRLFLYPLFLFPFLMLFAGGVPQEDGLTLFPSGSSGNSLEQSNVPVFRNESEHFKVYTADADTSVVDTLLSICEARYDYITGSLQAIPNSIIHLYVYPNQQDLHNALGWPNAPDWVIGGYQNDSTILIVSPLRPGTNVTFGFVINAAVHEFVHMVVRAAALGNFSKWIDEAAATYLTGQNTTPYRINYYYNHNNGIPSLADLENIENYGTLGGYDFVYTIAEFVVDSFDMNTFAQFIQYFDDYSLMNMSGEQEFEERWQQFVGVKYLNWPAAIDEEEVIPGGYELRQNYPNPFNPSTVIEFELRNSAEVKLDVVTLSGKIISTLVQNRFDAGLHTVTFNGRDAQGNHLASGVYLYRLSINSEFTRTRKMLLIK